ncbi:polysialyltransferase family glycosyltransferase [Streptomyces sp. 4N509B]|uniref:polysialyltransferase family glycosyltransferase n=1 Tax=Streptomyces sp. 4N509B TaxID=3457413 RepID=UPI003FD45E20
MTPTPVPPHRPDRAPGAPGTPEAPTQILVASTLYGAATLAAALDSGLLPVARRRVLLVCNNAASPETTPALDEAPGFERLRSRFDEVRSWNDAISPMHPGSWEPRAGDVPMWERHLRMLWRLGDEDVALVLESIQVNPARALAQLFPAAPIDVYADGLMSYGPTRNRLPTLVGTRVGRLFHPELLPGVRPLLLTEFGVTPEVVPAAAMKKVLGELADATPDVVPKELTAVGDAEEPPALLLGQYLSALGILSAAEEQRLHARMLRGVAALGHRRAVFKPHPTAPPDWTRRLAEEAAALDVELTVLDTPVLAEVLYERLRPSIVVGAFSTALLTASVLYGLPVARVGTEMLLERLSPFQNSNRVPVTVVDAILPDLDDAEAVRAWRMPGEEECRERLAGLLAAVGFTMQPQLYPELRGEAERYLETKLNGVTRRYFKRRRLTVLALPGAVPRRLAFIPRNRTVRGAARRVRALQRRLTPQRG